ncbi:MAG: GNAT family N-acetyltransferase [Bacteroidales bacterium]|nr:GNAT family N-acetyltransferase [Bacteroidales bacterium]
MVGKEITVIERPESVSWEEISSVLKQAHADNVKKGIVLPYPALPPLDIYAKTEGRGGKMVVALYKGKVVGTGAVAVINKKLWCGQGKYLYSFLDAVLPEYKGQGIYSQIEKWQVQYAKSVGLNRLLLDTHECNKDMIAIARKKGYRKVGYKIREGHNSVIMVKWLDGCPYSRLKCRLMFARKKRDKLDNAQNEEQ